eukprot:448377-Pleurochrysis_carterae.AAC.5
MARTLIVMLLSLGSSLVVLCVSAFAASQRKTIFPMKSFDCLNALIGDTEVPPLARSPARVDESGLRVLNWP